MREKRICIMHLSVLSCAWLYICVCVCVCSVCVCVCVCECACICVLGGDRLSNLLLHMVLSACCWNVQRLFQTPCTCAAPVTSRHHPQSQLLQLFANRGLGSVPGAVVGKGPLGSAVATVQENMISCKHEM